MFEDFIDDLPVLYHTDYFHLPAGKDRAGTCAELILLALGVPEDTVIHDHGLSNIYIADAVKEINERIKAVGIDPDDVAPYFTAPRNSIIASVNHIRKTYGSTADYLKEKGASVIIRYMT